MTGRLVDMAFTLGGKQRVTLELNGDFREIWDKLHLEPILDVEVKKHREKRSHSANAYFHVLVNKIAAETGESDDLVKERPQLRHDLPLPSLRRLCRRTQGV